MNATQKKKEILYIKFTNKEIALLHQFWTAGLKQSCKKEKKAQRVVVLINFKRKTCYHKENGYHEESHQKGEA